MNPTDLARFLAKVDRQDDGCWIFTSGAEAGGYAQFWIDGRMRLAHRVSYEHFVAPVPDGLQLDHLCRVRRCVNPQHLEPVTGRENSLRSPFTVQSINASRTECPQGHTLPADRRCRACHAAKKPCPACGKQVSMSHLARHRRRFHTVSEVAS